MSAYILFKHIIEIEGLVVAYTGQVNLSLASLRMFWDGDEMRVFYIIKQSRMGLLDNINMLLVRNPLFLSCLLCFYSWLNWFTWWCLLISPSCWNESGPWMTSSRVILHFTVFSIDLVYKRKIPQQSRPWHHWNANVGVPLNALGFTKDCGIIN